MKRAERLNQELIFLSLKKSFNLSDLMKEFNISKRTALRDIQDLEFLGLPFYVENGRNGGYKSINEKLIIDFLGGQSDAGKSKLKDRIGKENLVIDVDEFRKYQNINYSINIILILSLIFLLKYMICIL